MSDGTQSDTVGLAVKIARLVQERGWNQEEFARIARLNRHTVRQILAEDGARRLRNATIGACARALGLTVNDLRSLPLDRLLPRMTGAATTGGPDEGLRRLARQAVQPELVSWLERNPERARQLTSVEADELLALQGPEGPLVAFGVEGFVVRLERRRRLLQRVTALSATEYLEMLEQLVELMYDKVRPESRA